MEQELSVNRLTVWPAVTPLTFIAGFSTRPCAVSGLERASPVGLGTDGADGAVDNGAVEDKSIRYSELKPQLLSKIKVSRLTSVTNCPVSRKRT